MNNKLKTFLVWDGITMQYVGTVAAFSEEQAIAFSTRTAAPIVCEKFHNIDLAIAYAEFDNYLGTYTPRQHARPAKVFYNLDTHDKNYFKGLRHVKSY